MTTPTETTRVGVDDPYACADRCDHLTSDGQCRGAIQRTVGDHSFWHRLEAREYECPVAAPDCEWTDCIQFRSTTNLRECRRCGLEERRDLLDPEQRVLLEEHHVVYPDSGEMNHEVTVALCRWCHAKIHRSWAKIDDDVGPDPEAIAVREQRRAREHQEFSFSSAADRREE